MLSKQNNLSWSSPNMNIIPTAHALLAAKQAHGQAEFHRLKEITKPFIEGLTTMM